MAWYNPSWSLRVPITSQNAKVAEVVTNAYVDLSLLGSEFWSTVKNGGGDIRVTKADGTTEVAREVVFCDTGTDKGELHIDSTGIQTGSDVLWYIYVGNAAASDYAEDATYGREAVWTGFAFIAHMNEDPSGTPPQMLDSTSNDNDGTSGGSMVTGDLVTADVGKAIAFEKAKSQYIDFGNAAIIMDVGDKTYTIILKGIDQGSQQYLFSNRHAGILQTWGVVSGQVLSFAAFDGQGPGWQQVAWDASGLSGAAYHSIHGVVDDGSNVYLYVNGALKDSASVAALAQDSGRFSVAAQYTTSANTFADTTVSEMRIANTVRSANYIATEHNNLLDVANFWSIGAAETQGTTLNRIGGVLDRTAAAVLVRVLT